MYPPVFTPQTDTKASACPTDHSTGKYMFHMLGVF
jgi:hypothetical protein